MFSYITEQSGKLPKRANVKITRNGKTVKAITHGFVYYTVDLGFSIGYRF